MQTKDEQNISSKFPEPFNLKDMRCYSASYATFSSYNVPQIEEIPRHEDNKLKRAKSMSFEDPEMQRQKRVAGYKVYSVERKVKGSFRKSFKWLKNRYTQIVYHHLS